MHAWIISGGSKKDRTEFVESECSKRKIIPADRTFVVADEISIGIDAIRAFTHTMQLAPYASPQKAGIFPDADTLTVEAQNAFLKLLEEPPPHTIFFLLTSSELTLLPTIRSRCQLIVLPAEKSHPDTLLDICLKFTEDIDSLTPGNKLKRIDEFLSHVHKEDVLYSLLNAYTIRLKRSPTRSVASRIHALTHAKFMAEHNVSIRSCLDWIYMLTETGQDAYEYVQ